MPFRQGDQNGRHEQNPERSGAGGRHSESLGDGEKLGNRLETTPAACSHARLRPPAVLVRVVAPVIGVSVQPGTLGSGFVCPIIGTLLEFVSLPASAPLTPA